MASEVKATCSCGLEKTVLVGGFMFNRNIEYFPAICSTCKDIIQVNLGAEKPSCSRCGSTEITPLNIRKERKWFFKGRTSNEIVERSGDNILTKEPYSCPRCNKNTLSFHRTGLMLD
jgi:DNA-directed RNA polymerase subunit M/transcription elongation factor TFIIS